MTELSEEDLALLRREGCLVDVRCAAEAAWGSLDHPYAVVDSLVRTQMEARVGGAFRVVGLTPGQPAEYLILAAVERRWPYHTVYLHHYGEGMAVEAIINAGDPDACRSDWRSWYGYDPDRAAALALAFVAAIRASEEGGDDGDDNR